MESKKTISIVIPMYNEELVFSSLVGRLSDLCESLKEKYRLEIIMVDDGCSDSTWTLISESTRKHSWIKGVRLSRNFGHQIALTCGHHYASGDAVVDMDADLQDPPEFIPTMIEAWESGAEIVLWRRKTREGENKFKLLTAKIFYRLVDFFSEVNLHNDVGDFRLISKRANDYFICMSEKSRYVRGMISWMGFNSITLEYNQDERESGKTHYSFLKMLRLAMDGIISMSSRPLKIAYVLAIFGSFPFLIYLGLAYWRASVYRVEMVPGWTSTILAIVSFGTLILIMLGVIGEYLGRLYEEVKPRPLFFVEEVPARFIFCMKNQNTWLLTLGMYRLF